MCTRIITYSLALLSSYCFASNQVLVLSGGGDPGLNHYSQYLQTKTIYEYVASKYGNNNTTIYFGMGNNPNTTSPFPDVHQIKTNNGTKIDYMLPGVIPNNKVATKENVLSYFFSPEIVNNQDNLLLFVSDHGFDSNDYHGNPYSDNCINLWYFNQQLVNNFYDDNHLKQVCLSKNTLKTILENTQAKHVIFEMSQCYSGGFHQMSVTWQNGYPHANPKICGFTAATEDHWASGCTGDANGASYQGYERSFTEWYVGKSVPTGAQLRQPALNIWDAHKNAILEDMTADTPITTSDYYLLQWAKAFNDSDFKPRIAKYSKTQIKDIFNNYSKYSSKHNNQNLIAFENLLAKYEVKVALQYPIRKVFFRLNLIDQEKYIQTLEKKIAEKEQQYDAQTEGVLEIYRNVILPQWSKAIKNHSVNNLSSVEYTMENDLYLKTMDSKAQLFRAPYIFAFKNLFLQYLALNNNNSSIASYNKNRYTIISDWAKSNNLLAVANASNYFGKFVDNVEKNQQTLQDIEKEKQLLKRAYLYRKVIAAWITLEKINDTQALQELNGILQCQHSE